MKFSAAAALLCVVLAVPNDVAAQTSLSAGDESALRTAIFATSNDLATDGVVNNGPYTITLTANITLTKSLPMIRTNAPGGGVFGLTIEGANFTIDANNTGRVFLVERGSVLIRNVTIANARAQGGTGGPGAGGGGGGLGAGAAVFAFTSADVTLSNVTIGNASAFGGTGGGDRLEQRCGRRWPFRPRRLG